MREKINKLKIKDEDKLSKARTIMGFALIATLLLASVTLLYLRSQENGRLSKENQGYIRYLACVADIRNSKGVITVSDEISEACWDQAEKETGVHLTRYSGLVILKNN